MSNLGLQTMYRLFNAEDDIVASVSSCHRRARWRRSSSRELPLVTIESQTPVRDFDVLAFSVSFEWDYTNVLTLMRLAGIPPRATLARRDIRS